MGTRLSASRNERDVLACPLIDKVPPEVRVRIYRFLWSNLDGGLSAGHRASAPGSVSSIPNRRIYWKHYIQARPDSCSLPKLVSNSNLDEDDGFPDWEDKSDVLQNADDLDVERKSDVKKDQLVEIVSRLQSIDTGLFTVCKLIYAEAQFELLARSTVVVKLDNLKKLTLLPKLLNQLRRIEIRDYTKSHGSQVVPCSLTVWIDRWFDRESRENHHWPGIGHLQQVRSLLQRAPLLTSIVIGFEVLCVTLHDLDLREYGVDRDDEEFRSEMDYVLSSAGLGRFVCTELGIWRAESGEHSKVQIKHFNAIHNIAMCLAANACPCGGDEVVWRDTLGMAKFCFDLDVLVEFVFLRHRGAQYGLLGEEARQRCGGPDSMISATWSQKNWTMLGFL